MNLMRQMFSERLFSKSGDYYWSRRSPDLTAPDFFLWGFLKGKVYASKPDSLQQFKANIREEIAKITLEMLETMVKNTEKSADMYVVAGGSHLPDIIFKK